MCSSPQTTLQTSMNAHFTLTSNASQKFGYMNSYLAETILWIQQILRFISTSLTIANYSINVKSGYANNNIFLIIWSH